MGGGIFGLGRLPREKYLIIENEIRQYLDQRFGSHSHRIPRYYGAKPDFGDLDVLLSNDIPTWPEVRQAMVNELGIKESKTVGKLFSTKYRDFQVDFSLTKQENLESQSSYMAFNDLSNILGRLFRPFNLKYGENGLSYVYRRKNTLYSRDILVSRDWESILSFIGLDYDAWNNGFQELDDMFDWVLQSPYFRSSPYLDPRSPIMQKKTKQRTTIRRFIQYLEERQINRSLPEDWLDEKDCIDSIDAFFPSAGLVRQVQHERGLEREADEIASKFNGKLVMQWIPDLKDKALGLFIREFHQKYSKQQMLEWTPGEIEAQVRQLYAERHKSQTG